MSDNFFLSNGINGATGDYLLPPLVTRQIGAVALGESYDSEHLEELRWWVENNREPTWSVKAGVDANDLSQAGWGVIFARGLEEDIVKSLAPLLQWRQAQAGKLYCEFRDDDSPHPNESKLAFLSRHKVGPGPVDPQRVPYYLLLVGDPQAISYEFQYQLDVQYAVGRLHFDGPDHLARYAAYAQGVVASESGTVSHRGDRAAFFATQHDDATQASATLLVAPLVERLKQANPDWAMPVYMGAEAEKKTLAQLLGGELTPALLFTASHGLGFPYGDQRQFEEQGALLCQDWPNPLTQDKKVRREHYFCAKDITADCDLHGLIAIHFSCFGAGTPQRDDFVERAIGSRADIAPYGFVARLPQRLLGQDKGCALAVVGHIDRAWGFSFAWPGAGSQTSVFESALQSLLSGQTIGAAMEDFNVRYAEIATDLSLLASQTAEETIRPDYDAAARLWIARNDARNYAVLGDPAVRLTSPSSMLQTEL